MRMRNRTGTRRRENVEERRGMKYRRLRERYEKGRRFQRHEYRVTSQHAEEDSPWWKRRRIFRITCGSNWRLSLSFYRRWKTAESHLHVNVIWKTNSYRITGEILDTRSSGAAEDVECLKNEKWRAERCAKNHHMEVWCRRICSLNHLRKNRRALYLRGLQYRELLKQKFFYHSHLRRISANY